MELVWPVPPRRFPARPELQSRMPPSVRLELVRSESLMKSGAQQQPKPPGPPSLVSPDGAPPPQPEPLK